MIFNRKDGIIALVRDEQKKFPRGGIVLLINYQTDFTGIMINAREAREMWHLMQPKHRNLGFETDLYFC